MTANRQRRGPTRERIAIIGTMAETMLGFRGELIKDMVAEGHDVYAFATDYSDTTETQIRAMGAHPVRYRMARLSINPLADLFSVWQLYRLFRTLRITLSYAYFSKPALYATLAASLAGVPRRVAKIEGLGRIFTVDPQGDSLPKILVRRVMQGLFRTILPLADKVFVLNQGDKDDLMRFGVLNPEPKVIGGIGVCLERYAFHPPVVRPMRFIFVGRLLPEKGIRYFVQAAKAIKQDHPDTEFILLGAPDAQPGAVDRNELGALVAAGTVIWPGAVSDVVPWLASSSVFVLPTYYREGVPRSTQEALAMGRPVITTTVPGCMETVREGVNGFLVPPHDQAALEQAMRCFIAEPDLVTSMGLASFHLARERFNVRQINLSILREMDLLRVERKRAPAGEPLPGRLQMAVRSVQPRS